MSTPASANRCAIAAVAVPSSPTAHSSCTDSSETRASAPARSPAFHACVARCQSGDGAGEGGGVGGHGGIGEHDAPQALRHLLDTGPA